MGEGGLCGACCLCMLAVPAVFFLVVSPFLAVGGPWVSYTLDTQRLDQSGTNITEFNLQYPMLLFDRQQYLGKMCFSRITLELWMAVFHKDPQISCTKRRGYRTSCHFVYCLYDWDVRVNNRTKFSHNVVLFTGPPYYMTVTDACWWLWWAPAIILAIFCPPAVPVIYTIFTFALRVSLSVASLFKFYDYNALTDPPYTGYFVGSTNLQRATYWKYDWGLAFGWITAISNAIGFLIVLIGGIVYFCSSTHRDMMEDHIGGWRSRSRKLTGRFRKGSDDTERKSSESGGHDPDAKSEQPYKQLKEDPSAPRNDYGTSGTNEKQWPPPPAYDAAADR